MNNKRYQVEYPNGEFHTVNAMSPCGAVNTKEKKWWKRITDKVTLINDVYTVTEL